MSTPSARMLFFFLLTASCIAAAPSALAKPSEAVKKYREQMFDPPMRMLANRTLAEMFHTARVKAADEPSRLETNIVPLDFTYEFQGERRKADEVVESTATDALLIIKNGRVVHEGYYNQSTELTRFNSYSAAKSVNAIMVGLALKDGKIGALTDAVTKYAPELSGTGYDGTTIRDLLEMRSGIAWVENFFTPGNLSYDAHVSSWVQERARYTDTARLTRHEHEPGTFFRYNSMDAAVVGLVIARAMGMPVSRYLSERLWQRAGMEADAFYVIDGPPGVGQEFTAGGFNAVLRDYGRLGLLMLDHGRANGEQFFPEGYVSSLSSSVTADADPNFGYGYFWWTVKGTEAFTAVGGEGQFIYVDPPSQTVIVKLSHGPVGPEAVPVVAETLAFFRAASAWNGAVGE